MRQQQQLSTKQRNPALVLAASLLTVVAVFHDFQATSVAAFVQHPPNKAPHTRLFLEDWVADMIDGELFRQGHKKEYEQEWMEKNRNAVFSRIETDFVNFPQDDPEDYRMHQKDQRLAFKDPEKYCADRCVATGNCDIFEDFYEMSPEDVIAFCTECVLSEDEDGECPIPDGFYDKPRP